MQEETSPSFLSRIGIWFRRLFLVVLVLLCLPLALVPIYTVVPPISTLMLYDLVTLKGFQRQWVAFEDIAEVTRNSVVTSEDARFCEHNGIDWIEFERVWNAYWDGEETRGASTIPMQTVKNLFLWHGPSPVRKAIELPLSLYADFVWSKKRTLEIYLNIVELDAQIYGIEAGAQHYFDRSAAELNARQSALLAVTLPNPQARNPAKPTSNLRRLARTIEARARSAGPYVQCLKQEN